MKKYFYIISLWARRYWHTASIRFLYRYHTFSASHSFYRIIEKISLWVRKYHTARARFLYRYHDFMASRRFYRLVRTWFVPITALLLFFLFHLYHYVFEVGPFPLPYKGVRIYFIPLTAFAVYFALYEFGVLSWYSFYIYKYSGIRHPIPRLCGQYERPPAPSGLDYMAASLFRGHRYWFIDTYDLLIFLGIRPSLNNYILFACRLLGFGITFFLFVFVVLRVFNISLIKIIYSFTIGFNPLAYASPLGIWLIVPHFICVVGVLMLLPFVAMICYHSFEILRAAAGLKHYARFFDANNIPDLKTQGDDGWRDYQNRCRWRLSWR